MDHDDHDHHPHGETAEGRVTSPMQEFSTGQVGIGFAVLLVGPRSWPRSYLWPRVRLGLIYRPRDRIATLGHRSRVK